MPHNENCDEFDRNSSRYKQFKVRNTRRTSTPQPLVRPKYIRRNIHCDLHSPPVQSPPQPPSRCPDVDTTYVSYVQWRHYLVVPNSVRKFKVRCIGVPNGRTILLRIPDTIISGNMNMSPVSKAPTTATKIRKPFASKSTKTNAVDLLNSRIAIENKMAECRERGECREHVERRNQRIVDLVVPLIKKSLKRFFASEPERNAEPVKSKTARILKSLNPRHRRERSEDREYLINCYDGVELEE